MFTYRPIIGLYASESMNWGSRAGRTAHAGVSTEDPAGSSSVRDSHRIVATSNAGFAAAGWASSSSSRSSVSRARGRFGWRAAAARTAGSGSRHRTVGEQPQQDVLGGGGVERRPGQPPRGRAGFLPYPLRRLHHAQCPRVQTGPTPRSIWCPTLSPSVQRDFAPHLLAAADRHGAPDRRHRLDQEDAAAAGGLPTDAGGLDGRTG